MKRVIFEKQWRGHLPSDSVVELTDERAAELIAQKICRDADKPKRGRPKKSAEPAPEPEPEPEIRPETIVPETDNPTAP